MNELWESRFIERQAMWGYEPAESAIAAKDFFLEKHINDILIPGIGYGRNAKPFLENGINVTGIEISQTAIELARNQNELDIAIYHGSVTDMPFDDKRYDGIFAYALIHLFNIRERRKLIRDCYHQLKPGGYMIFSVVSKEYVMFGKGKQISKDRWEAKEGGVKLFFYDTDSIQREFGNYGLLDITPVDEPVKNKMGVPSTTFLLIKCQKQEEKP